MQVSAVVLTAALIWLLDGRQSATHLFPAQPVIGQPATVTIELEAAVAAASAVLAEEKAAVSPFRICRPDFVDPECPTGSTGVITERGPKLESRVWTGLLMTVGARQTGPKGLQVQRPMFRGDTLEVLIRVTSRRVEEGAHAEYVVHLVQTGAEQVAVRRIDTLKGPGTP